MNHDDPSKTNICGDDKQQNLKGQQCHISSHTKGVYLFTTDICGYVKQWDIKRQKLLKDFGKVHHSVIMSIDATSDRKYLITSDYLGNIRKWDIENQSQILDKNQIPHKEIDVNITSISASIDSQY